ncbi:MAG: FHA domain-containing protein [Planctomycetota bacterium]
MMEMHVCNKVGAVLRAFMLGDMPELIVGRDETCDIRILSQSVSREHASIEQDEDGLVIRDMKSTGGTFLEGQRIETVRIQDGMEIKIGPAVLKFYETGI